MLKIWLNIVIVLASFWLAILKDYKYKGVFEMSTVVHAIILKDTYRDSVFLMKISSQAKTESGAVQVSAMMGTSRNKELFEKSGLLSDEVSQSKPDDLVIAFETEKENIEAVASCVERLLNEAPSKASTACGQAVPTSLEEALKENKNINLSLISVAGDYAKYEAIKAVSKGIDVMLYSDNISVADELAIKELASKKGCIVMGPDCGTAIINGVPLAFANAVKTGSVGIVGASGTGLQELTCLLDRFGVGISNAYGTGGRDLKDEIGGISAITALNRLKDDEQTKIIAVIGKPPGIKTREKLAEILKNIGKPVFVHYLGASDYKIEEQAGFNFADDLTKLSENIAHFVDKSIDTAKILGADVKMPKAKGFMRGLFGGGTLCQEAAELVADLLDGDKYSNLKVKGFNAISGSEKSKGHCFWDFGEDEFTVGRPHPMMAPDLKLDRLVEELTSDEVGVVLMDMVIGYGAHQDQANLVLQAIEKADKISGGKSKEKAIVMSVCGTDGDNPSLSAQIEELKKANIIILGSNAKAAIFAANILN